MNTEDVWTHERVSKVWNDLRADLANTRATPASPPSYLTAPSHSIQLLRRRFRKELDASALDAETSKSLAQLWCVWGILEAGAAQRSSIGFERRVGFEQALTVIEAAMQFANEPQLTGEILFNLGAAQLVSTMYPMENGLHLSAVLGLVDWSTIPFTATGSKADRETWRSAARSFQRCRELVSSESVREHASQMLVLSCCLEAIITADLGHHSRVAALGIAQQVLDESSGTEPIRAWVRSAKDELEHRSLFRRFVDRTVPGLTATHLRSIFIEPIFRLPEGVHLES